MNGSNVRPASKHQEENDMGFIIGTLLGLIGGAWLAHRYHSTIEAWLDKVQD